MFHLHYSNKLEHLISILAKEHVFPVSPFESDIFIVQNKGMGRWVALRLAERWGICANIRFLLPAVFIWELFREQFGELPKRSPFSSEVLTFRIMEWLNHPKNLSSFPLIRNYISDKEQRRKFHLARHIAEIFDQYLIYREDWLAHWEQGQLQGLGIDETWQATLWQDLVSQERGKHRARLMQELRQKLYTQKITEVLATKRVNLSRVTVFGVSSLPPVFLETLRAVSAYREVVVYALNPCHEYWADIRDIKEISRLAKEQSPDDLYLEIGHPLLASLGKQSREFFHALADSAQTFAYFEDVPERDSLLHIIQADIVELVDRKKEGCLELPPDDTSLQIHVCHSPLREVEILRDQLLAWFEADPTLHPSDVAVLTPSIETYVSCINMVFSSGKGLKIPFSIADRVTLSHHPLFETFLTLLDLPDSRFHVDTTVSLLEQRALRKRFNLLEEDLPQIHTWVRTVGVRWGRDREHEVEQGLYATPRYTWRDALECLFLGYAMPRSLAGEKSYLFCDRLPYNDIEGNKAEKLGWFTAFLETLFTWSERLRTPLPPAEWADSLNVLVDSFFDPTGHDEEVIKILRSHFEALRDVSIQARFHRHLSHYAVKDWLSERLHHVSGTAGFLTGEVTCCEMIPMRSLPFRIIALLGINYGTFPRPHCPLSFDLMAQHRRAGDRSRQLDDRSLFLETLLSARERLYISYVGRSMLDNSVHPPSSLVSELIDTIKKTVSSSDGADIEKQFIVEHPLHPFDKKYFLANKQYPGYSREWFSVAKAMSEQNKVPPVFFEEPLPEPENEWRTLTTGNLLYFFHHPVRYLLQKRLDIRLKETKTAFEIREPFKLEGSAKKTIHADVLDGLCRGIQETAILAAIEAKGILPHGHFGRALYEEERTLLRGIEADWINDMRAPRYDPIRVDFESKGIRLEGFLEGVYAIGLREYYYKEAHPGKIISLWIKHLLLCLFAPEGAEKCSILRTPKTKTIMFQYVPDAQYELEKWLDAYWAGMSKPLPFFPHISLNYVENCLKKNGSKENAFTKAMEEWENANSGIREKYGYKKYGIEYYQLAYRNTNPIDDEFGNVAIRLLQKLVECKNKKKEPIHTNETRKNTRTKSTRSKSGETSCEKPT